MVSKLFDYSEKWSNLSVMDKLLAMKTFVQIVDQGSLTAAADSMNKSLPSVVRILANLEESLDTRLLNRTTRHIALTDEGRRYLARCRQILWDIDEAENELGVNNAEPRGDLTVTAPIMFGKMHVAPSVVSFLQRYEQTRVNLLLLDSVVNLIDDGVDVAIRIGHLSDSTMIAKQVGEIKQVVCASPIYLRENNGINHPEALAHHQCIRFTGLGASSVWRFVDKGKPIVIQTNGALSCNQIQVTLDACVDGLGVGQFLSYQVEPLIREGKLVVLLAEYEPSPMPINVVYSNAKLLSSRVRVFVDWMTKALSQLDQ